MRKLRNFLNYSNKARALTANIPGPTMTQSRPRSVNQRDSFRIDKDIHFEFKLCSSSFVDDNQVDDAFDDDDDATRLIAELAAIDRNMHQALAAIRDKNQFLGDVLKSMNSKIDTIGRHVGFQSDSSLRSRPKTRVSISEDGIGFIADRAFYKGNFIAIRMMFLPNYAMASSYAEIVRCVQKDDKFQIAAKFHKINDKDRQVLARFLLKSQAEMNKQV